MYHHVKRLGRCYDTSKHNTHHHSQVDRVYLLNFVTFDDLEF
jgi:hypothetical protein